MGKNARKAAYEFDFNKLTSNLIDIIKTVIKEGNYQMSLYENVVNKEEKISVVGSRVCRYAYSSCIC